MADTPAAKKRPILAVPLWMTTPISGYSFPYDQVAPEVAKVAIAAGHAQDLRATYAWTLKKPGAVPEVSSFAFGAPAVNDSVAAAKRTRKATVAK